MDNEPEPQSLRTSTEALQLLLRVAVGALEGEDLLAAHLVIVALRKGFQHPMKQTRYRDLTATALEEAEGWLHKAMTEE
jgi:hypothetical protein